MEAGDPMKQNESFIIGEGPSLAVAKSMAYAELLRVAKVVQLLEESGTVDPKVYALAESFVDDVLRELDGDDIRRIQMTNQRRDRLIRQAADAMQQAIEDECEAIRQELSK